MKNNDRNSILILIREFLTVFLTKQKNYSDHTVTAYRFAIRSFLEYVCESTGISLEDVTGETFSPESLQGFHDMMVGKGYAEATVLQRMMALYSFLKYAAAKNPELLTFTKSFKTIALRKQEKKPVEYLSENAVREIFLQPATDTKTGIRDLTIMVVLYDTAARVSELLSIRLSDLDLDSTPCVTLFGKGQKKRIVPLMNNTVAQLNRYLSVYHPEENLFSREYLFYTVRKGTRFAMSDDNIRRLLTKYADMARVSCPEIPEKIYPHLWRHTRAMHLYQHGMDLMLISQWLGHADINTTQIYAYADIEKKREAIKSASGNVLPSEEYETEVVDNEETLKRLYGLK